MAVHSPLDPTVGPFLYKDSARVHRGVLVPDLAEDWTFVQEVHASLDNISTSINHDSHPTLGYGTVDETRLLPLPSADNDNTGCLQKPASPLLKANSLHDKRIPLPQGEFIDKILPSSRCIFGSRETFTGDYFVSLHNLVAAPGVRSDGTTYPAFTDNHLGARIKLSHTGLKPDRWRYHLLGYEHSEVVQFIEYGFPLGLSELAELESCTRNHGSSYGFYTHVDNFVAEEIHNGGVTGPFPKAPWWDSIVSPLMTAPKKPASRRTVYDATYGDKSLNNATPSDFYLGQPCVYTFPKIDDFRRMVLRCGHKSFMWKRDLSRFFLQIPMDPKEYHRVCFIWRGLFFFFLGLAFGLRHSGLQGQRLTDAVSWIHRRRGLETDHEEMFNVANYSDDLGGCESTKARALESFGQLGFLFKDLGLDESLKKAEGPSHRMTYLGVMFDTESMTMMVPPDKLAEIKDEINRWARKTTISKKDLQSLLGKLFWVAKVVRYARAFMGRLLQQLRTLANTKDSYKVKIHPESQKDLMWWSRYLDHFNGIQMIVNEDPFELELDQMLDRPFDLCAGDATPVGGGAWYGDSFWSREFPRHLQDPLLPIHLKEFWVVIVSSRLWGDSWSGRSVIIWCDNDAVVDTITYKKPKDPALLSLLREFLHVVVTKKFFPVLRKISTGANHLADFISRRHDNNIATEMFSKAGLHKMVPIEISDSSFKLTEPW